MARTSTPNVEVPEHQQMNRSNDPEVTAALDEAAPEMAMESRRQRFAGSAAGVGSVGFDEEGAFDVGAAEGDEDGDGADARPG